MSNSGRAPPPQLHFDDGSRILALDAEKGSRPVAVSSRGQVPLMIYYEIERLASEVIECMSRKNKTQSQEDGWLCRVALQFPDALLRDAPEVSYAMEDALTKIDASKPPLVFVLGDTTFGSCCPDEVTALHLQADVLIHYGHACLSPALSLPVLYSFGITNMDVSDCVEKVTEQVQASGVNRLLLLFNVHYYHAIEELQTSISEQCDALVVVGQIPPQDIDVKSEQAMKSPAGVLLPMRKVGGLEIPSSLDLSSFTLMFIGDPTNGRQFVNMMLHFVSLAEKGPSSVWTYNPLDKSLDTSLPNTIQRQLNRRYYLTQKARDATTFGILVGTLSQRHFTDAVSKLQTTIQDAGRSCYTFAVGKINGAKLANFGEIECYVLVACSENSILDDERDLHVPVITPLELDVALGNIEWGEYNLDYNSFLSNTKHREENNVEADDADAPYFSMITGQFEDSRKSTQSEVNLSALPGKGQVAVYSSKGAEYLKSREYTGLETQLGKTEIRAAVEGQNGIASDYGNR